MDSKRNRRNGHLAGNRSDNVLEVGYENKTTI